MKPTKGTTKRQNDQLNQVFKIKTTVLTPPIKGLHKTFCGTANKCENKNLT